MHNEPFFVNCAALQEKNLFEVWFTFTSQAKMLGFVFVKLILQLFELHHLFHDNVYQYMHTNYLPAFKNLLI